jgi:hypothetical protein
MRLLAVRVPRSSRHYLSGADWHAVVKCAACRVEAMAW